MSQTFTRPKRRDSIYPMAFSKIAESKIIKPICDGVLVASASKARRKIQDCLNLIRINVPAAVISNDRIA